MTPTTPTPHMLAFHGRMIAASVIFDGTNEHELKTPSKVTAFLHGIPADERASIIVLMSLGGLAMVWARVLRHLGFQTIMTTPTREQKASRSSGPPRELAAKDLFELYHRDPDKFTPLVQADSATAQVVSWYNRLAAGILARQRAAATIRSADSALALLAEAGGEKLARSVTNDDNDTDAPPTDDPEDNTGFDPDTANALKQLKLALANHPVFTLLSSLAACGLQIGPRIAGGLIAENLTASRFPTWEDWRNFNGLGYRDNGCARRRVSGETGNHRPGLAVIWAFVASMAERAGADTAIKQLLNLRKLVEVYSLLAVYHIADAANVGNWNNGRQVKDTKLPVIRKGTGRDTTQHVRLKGLGAEVRQRSNRWFKGFIARWLFVAWRKIENNPVADRVNPDFATNLDHARQNLVALLEERRTQVPAPLMDALSALVISLQNPLCDLANEEREALAALDRQKGEKLGEKEALEGRIAELKHLHPGRTATARTAKAGIPELERQITDIVRATNELSRQRKETIATFKERRETLFTDCQPRLLEVVADYYRHQPKQWHKAVADLSMIAVRLRAERGVGEQAAKAA